MAELGQRLMIAQPYYLVVEIELSKVISSSYLQSNAFYQGLLEEMYVSKFNRLHYVIVRTLDAVQG